MKLVVDTNVVFSALIAGGMTREIIITGNHDLSLPEFFHTELLNNRHEIQKKSGLDHSELDLLLNLLFEDVQVVPRDEFDGDLSRADDHIGDVDPDDVPFLALALHLDAEVWSDDEHFQRQSAVRAWRTHELVARNQSE